MSAPLFPGESIQVAGGYPALCYYKVGKPELPLVVFLSAGPIMSRIAYGHPGSQKEDFIAHWISDSGHSVLAITHPMDHPAFPTRHPEFTLQDFGRQIAEIVEEKIGQDKLLKQVILVGYSAAGRAVQAATSQLSYSGIDVLCFISMLALTPQLTLLPMMTRGFKMSSCGYAIYPFDHWHEENLTLQEALCRRSLISANNFQDLYMAPFPINVWESLYRFDRDEFVPLLEEGLSDSGAYAYQQYPLIALLGHDSVKDKKQALMGPGIWSYYLTQVLYQNLFATSTKDLNTLSEFTWKKLLDNVRGAPQKLFATVDGGAFFFIGEKGAKASVIKLFELASKVQTLKADILRLLK